MNKKELFFARCKLAWYFLFKAPEETIFSYWANIFSSYHVSQKSFISRKALRRLMDSVETLNEYIDDIQAEIEEDEEERKLP